MKLILNISLKFMGIKKKKCARYFQTNCEQITDKNPKIIQLQSAVWILIIITYSTRLWNYVSKFVYIKLPVISGKKKKSSHPVPIAV